MATDAEAATNGHTTVSTALGELTLVRAPAGPGAGHAAAPDAADDGPRLTGPMSRSTGPAARMVRMDSDTKRGCSRPRGGRGSAIPVRSVSC